jgi:hypothetical protein
LGWVDILDLCGAGHGVRNDQYRFRLVESVSKQQLFPTCFISSALSNEFSGI